MSETRILIVADTRETVDELRDFFELHGYETEVALNGKVAFAIIEERKMDLAIIGYKVQELQGTDIMHKIRGVDPFIPVILIHGNKSKRIRSLVKKAGAQEYVPKPIEKNSFLVLVRKILISHSNRVLPKQ